MLAVCVEVGASQCTVRLLGQFGDAFVRGGAAVVCGARVGVEEHQQSGGILDIDKLCDVNDGVPLGVIIVDFDVRKGLFYF